MKNLVLVLITSIFSFSLATDPVLIIHRLGYSCSGDYMTHLINKINSTLNAYAECIESGGYVTDFVTSILTQSKKLCQSIQNNSHFQGNFSIVSFSQGGLIGRYIIEECEMKGTVRRYIAIGTPQRGVAKIPLCFTGVVCYGLQKLSSFLIYSSFIQNHLGPAGYYVDVLDRDKYLKGSTFLPELNNELTVNEKYKERFSKLDKVVLMKFNSDTIIYPREGAWFEFIDQQGNLIPLNQSDFYVNDNIGLRRLMSENKVLFAESAGNHLMLTEEEENKYIIGCL